MCEPDVTIVNFMAVARRAPFSSTTPNGQRRGQPVVGGSGLNVRQNLTYAYDPTGNILSITDVHNGNQVQAFEYDALDRLQRYQVSGGTSGTWSPQWFVYDVTGNLTAIHNNNAQGSEQRSYNNGAQRGATDCTVGGLNLAHAAVGRTELPSGVITHYCYNNVGNMVERQTGSVQEALTYDPENRLIGLSGGSTTASFAYNGDGQRTRATINGTTTLYAGGIEYEVGSGTFTIYYDAGGQRVAIRKGAALQYLLNDHLGSTSVILKTNGTLWGELRYSAWGQTRYSFGNIPTDRQFTGQINDGVTGLYYYNARYYDPALHRFIQADTIVPDPNDPQSLNRYAYTNNNPVRYTDPTGHYADAGDVGGTNARSVTRNHTRPTLNRRAALVVDKALAAGPVVVKATIEVAKVGAGALCEACDWAIALSDGFQPTDAVGMLPFIPAAAGRYADDAIKLGTGALRYTDEVPINCLHSFAGETLVTTSEGQMPIRSVDIGDEVLAFNKETNEFGYFPVSETWKHKDPAIVYITLNGETIITTPGHLFLTKELEWVKAANLDVKAEIYRGDGTVGAVESVRVIAAPRVMYDLTVEEAHTFTVGGGQWVVHNNCAGLLPQNPTQLHHVFPQSYRDRFENVGIDIDNYTVPLERSTHLSGIHGRGGFVGPGNVELPGRWNQRWDQFWENNPNATAKDIYQYAGSLMDEYGLSGLPIVPY